jgi:aminoglycoside phosphotransferase (APT) family kinase protein
MVSIDERMVGRLVAAQFPQWAELPVRAVIPGGIDNRTFRLGDDLAVRMPSAAGYAAAVEKEQRWLPVIARGVTLPVPEPLGHGIPGEGYEFAWSINRWLPGETAAVGAIDDLNRFAVDLAGFLRELQGVETQGAPVAGAHSFFRGASLLHYDDETRAAIATLGHSIDGPRATAMWEDGLGAVWSGQPVWFHGDVSAGNLLVERGRLSAVIDFGTSGVGDPACDLYIAWTTLDVESRQTFREALGVDDAMWARGRAWTLWKALITFAGGSEHGAWGREVVDRILSE